MKTATNEIAERLATVRERIANACARAHREVASVRLVLASKTQPPDTIAAAYAAGAPSAPSPPPPTTWLLLIDGPPSCATGAPASPPPLALHCRTYPWE